MSKIIFIKPSLYTPTLLLALMTTSHAFAAGTLLGEMSHLSTSTAGAGRSAFTENAYIAYTNPAGMAYVDKPQLSFNLALMDLQVEYNHHTDSSGSKKNAGSISPFGSFYGVLPYTENLAFGLTLTPTGGSALDYGTNYAGAETLNSVSLTVFQLNPAFSYKVDESLSFGIGLQLDYASAEQSAGLNTVKIKADDFAYGYNLGVMYRPNNIHQFGLTYRSKMDYNVNGELKDKVGGMIGSPGAVDFNTNLVHPEQIELSGIHKLSNPTHILWSLGYEGWSSNDTSTTKLNGDIALETIREFDDIWFASIGVHHDVTPKWRLEAGLGYMSSPLNDANRQTFDFPVAEQHRYALGATYKLLNSWTMSAYYSYIDMGSPQIQNQGGDGMFINSNQVLGVTANKVF